MGDVVDPDCSSKPPMSYTAVTTFSKKGFAEPGKHLLESFGRFWPPEIELVAYVEGDYPPYPRVRYLDLFSSCPHLAAFIERNKKNPKDESFVLKKKQPTGGFYWPIDHAGIRFAFKVYAVLHAIRTAKTDWVIWLDADTVTHTPITLEMLQSVTPHDALASYLGRDNLYPETGFVAYNLRHPKIQEFASSFEYRYDSDLVYTQSQYHDCVSLACEIKKFEKAGVRFYDIARENGIHSNNPFKKSVLGGYMAHHKARKGISLGDRLAYYARNIFRRERHSSTAIGNST